MNPRTHHRHACAPLAGSAVLASVLMTSAVASASPGSPPPLDTLPGDSAPPLSAPAPSACCTSPGGVDPRAAEPHAPEPRAPMYPPPVLDRPPQLGPTGDRVSDERLLHGFRLGYGYVADFDKPIQALDGKSLADKTNMRSPHNFLIGYEAFYRMVGHSWLNVILTANVIIAGLEQSQFYPTGNTLLGFEFKNSFQVGVGANLAPLKGNVAHTIFAAGWTPRVGSFYTPLHAFFIPDVDGVHRMGVLTGVTW